MPLRKRTFLILVLLLLPLLLPADTIPADKTLDVQVAALVSGRGFNFAQWEIGAVASKLKDLVVDPTARLDEDAAQQLVVDYVATARRIGELEGDITRLLSDPQQSNPEGAIAAWQAELDSLRQQQAKHTARGTDSGIDRAITYCLATNNCTRPAPITQTK